MISFEFSELQLQIQDAARRFAQDEIAPGVIERDRDAIFPMEIVKKLGSLGFLGMTVSPEYGGSGLDTISYVLAMIEISKVDASIAIVVSVQNSLVNWILEKFGSEEQKRKYLVPLAQGEKLGAYCLSEPEAGSDAREQRTLAKKVGSKWVLNGTKNWISTGQNADIYIVFAQTNPELKHKGIAAFIIERGTPGFEPGAKEDKMGMRSSDTCSIGLTNVEIPEENIIGNVGDGFYIAMKGLSGGRIGIASQAIGIAEGAFEAALRYSKTRKAFDVLISEHQGIQFKLAQMITKIDAAKLLTLKAAWLRDNGFEHNRQSSEAKLFASTIANEITRDAVQIHGGYGYVREYQVERMMRDAKVTEIYEGTSEIQHIVISRDLLKNYPI